MEYLPRLPKPFQEMLALADDLREGLYRLEERGVRGRSSSPAAKRFVIRSPSLCTKPTRRLAPNASRIFWSWEVVSSSRSQPSKTDNAKLSQPRFLRLRSSVELGSFRIASHNGRRIPCNAFVTLHSPSVYDGSFEIRETRIIQTRQHLIR